MVNQTELSVIFALTNFTLCTVCMLLTSSVQPNVQPKYSTPQRTTFKHLSTSMRFPASLAGGASRCPASPYHGQAAPPVKTFFNHSRIPSGIRSGTDPRPQTRRLPNKDSFGTVARLRDRGTNRRENPRGGSLLYRRSNSASASGKIIQLPAKKHRFHKVTLPVSQGHDA
jgi:hypothetical protein